MDDFISFFQCSGSSPGVQWPVTSGLGSKLDSTKTVICCQQLLQSPDSGLYPRGSTRCTVHEEGAGPAWPQQQLSGCSTFLMPAAKACGVGLSAVQLTGRPWAAIARVVLGPMATNCKEARHKRHSFSATARAVCRRHLDRLSIRTSFLCDVSYKQQCHLV